MDASTSHILTRFNSRKNCLIFGNWIFHENIAKISSNWGILLIQNNRFFGFKKPVFGYLKLAKITGFPRPVKTGVSTLKIGISKNFYSEHIFVIPHTEFIGWNCPLSWSLSPLNNCLSKDRRITLENRYHPKLHSNLLDRLSRLYCV